MGERIGECGWQPLTIALCEGDMRHLVTLRLQEFQLSRRFVTDGVRPRPALSPARDARVTLALRSYHRLKCP
eukprot:3254555-Pyramimonas_sp.AAC.1